jgi:hypothetical protein
LAESVAQIAAIEKLRKRSHWALFVPRKGGFCRLFIFPR